MKTKINTLLLLGGLSGLMFFSSCDSYLDIPVEAKVPTEDIDFTATENMYQPVSGLYAVARRRFTQWEAFPMLHVRADDSGKGGGSAQDQAQLTQIENFQYDQITGYFALNTTWEAYYDVVYTSYKNTELLDRYRENLTTPTEIELADSYEAEMAFIRSFAYFMLSNIWGEVPLVNPTELTQVSLLKSTVEEVKNQIYTDLDFAIAHLQDVAPSSRTDAPGGATKYSALALKAKVALYHGDYDIALDASNQVINSGLFSLYPDFYQLFKIPGKLANESLFEFQFTDFAQGSGDIIDPGVWFVHQGPRSNPNPTSGWGFNSMEQEFINFLTARGEVDRLDGSVLMANATTRTGEFINPSGVVGLDAYNGKSYLPLDQYTPGRLTYGTNNNVRVLRYAETLLINAEAKIRLQGVGAGDALINQVRTRAGIAPISGAGIAELLDERRAELSMEWGNRFFDLTRTKEAKNVLPGFVEGQHEYLPYPLQQVDLNPNLLL